jgi:hypothetical protein
MGDFASSVQKDLRGCRPGRTSPFNRRPVPLPESRPSPSVPVRSPSHQRGPKSFEQEGAELTEGDFKCQPLLPLLPPVSCLFRFGPGPRHVSHRVGGPDFSLIFRLFFPPRACPVPLGPWRKTLPPLYRTVFPPRRERSLFPAGNPSPRGNGVPASAGLWSGDRLKAVLQRVPSQSRRGLKSCHPQDRRSLSEEMGVVEHDSEHDLRVSAGRRRKRAEYG